MRIAEYNLSDIDKRIEEYSKTKIAQELEIGIPTLNDIVNELKKAQEQALVYERNQAETGSPAGLRCERDYG